MEEGLLESNPASLLESPRLPQYLPEVLSKAEMDRLLQLPDMREKCGRRDRCLLEMLYAAGLRVSEAVSYTHLDVYKRQG